MRRSNPAVSREACPGRGNTSLRRWLAPMVCLPPCPPPAAVTDDLTVARRFGAAGPKGDVYGSYDFGAFESQVMSVSYIYDFDSWNLRRDLRRGGTCFFNRFGRRASTRLARKQVIGRNPVSAGV